MKLKLKVITFHPNKQRNHITVHADHINILIFCFTLRILFVPISATLKYCKSKANSPWTSSFASPQAIQ